MAGIRAVGASLTLAILIAAPAAADWQPAQRIDNTGAQFLEFVDGDLGTGANGLTTAFFWQRTQTSGDSGQLYGAQRTADGAWGAPAAAAIQTTVTPTLTDAVSAADGTTLGAFTFDRTLRTITWGVAATAPSDVFNTGVIAEGDNGNAPNAPDIAIDGAGNAYAVSVRRLSGYRAVVFKYDAATGIWSNTPMVASVNDGRVYNPKIAVNATGDIAVSWAAALGQPGDKVMVARKLTSEADFGPASTANRQVSEQEALPPDPPITEDVNQHDVAIDADGNITVAYAQDRARFAPQQGQPQSYDRIYAVRWPAGASKPDLTTRKLISSPDPEAGSTYDPQLVTSPQGRVTLGWRQLADPVAPPAQSDDQLFIAEYSGAWGGPAAVTEADAPAYDLAVDGAGVLTVAWVEGSVAKARRKPPGAAFTAEAVISLAGVTAGAVNTAFAPHVSDSQGTQTDVLFKQKLVATNRDQALAARFVPAVAPGPEPTPVPPASDCPVDNAVQTGDDGDNTLTGTAGNDTLLALGGADTLSGLGGVDCLRAGAGNDRATGGEAGDDVDGGDGADTVEGNEGNDAVTGGDGDDLLAGQDGVDRIEGGGGNDRGLGGNLNDFLLGGSGDDRLFGQANSDLVGGDEGNDVVNGGDGNDLLAGGEGNDRLVGGRQKDTAVGQEGDDNLKGGAGSDKLFGDDGNDRLSGGAGKDALSGGDGIGRLFGGSGGDLIGGGPLGDVLSGSRGNDRIFGDAGDDRINLGKGRDRVDAGPGGDRISARDGQRDVVACGTGSDRVTADPRDKVDFTCEFVKVKRVKRAAG